ncbi:MAG: phospholipase D family protein [Chloroflexota bacterium]|nr:phospholipase D family protein [Chloroflexota bacterium]
MDTAPDTPVELVTSPWTITFCDLVDMAEEDLLVASPFISNKPLKKIVEIIESKHLLDSAHVSIVTNLAVDSLLSGSLDIAALLYLAQSIPNSTVTYLPSLHAKIYVADTKAAVVTSANLTNKGLAGNHEYGVLLRDSALVSKVRIDLTRYASLGNTVSLDTLIALNHAAQELKAVRQRADRSIKAQLKAAFEQLTEGAKLELLKARAKGKTTHSIFSDTVLYLLEQKGPLRTVELHPLVQQIHPDLCDDTIDRVIGSVHFGKKWKHYVRNTQQALKRKGLVGFDGQCWFRVA